MSEDDVDVGVVETLQGALQAFDNVLLRQTPANLLVG
jgi:hypothetical protein